jgi:hypothetical protein
MCRTWKSPRSTRLFNDSVLVNENTLLWKKGRTHNTVKATTKTQVAKQVIRVREDTVDKSFLTNQLSFIGFTSFSLPPLSHLLLQSFPPSPLSLSPLRTTWSRPPPPHTYHSTSSHLLLRPDEAALLEEDIPVTAAPTPVDWDPHEHWTAHLHVCRRPWMHWYRMQFSEQHKWLRLSDQQLINRISWNWKTSVRRRTLSMGQDSSLQLGKGS